MNHNLSRRQKGFTLIEILVALAILAAISLLASNAFDGSRSKAQTMISVARQIADANIQLKTDTGCFVKVPKALFDPDAAQEPNNNYCNRVFKNTWSRPYLAQYPTDADGKLVLDKIAAGVLASFEAEAGGMGKRYFVRFADVPKDIIKQALVECNNTDEEGGNFDKDRCRTPDDLAGDEPGRFEVLYDTTR